MARNLSGVYSLPAGSIVSTGDTILPTQHNTPLNDIASDLNLPRPVVAGGTGADNAASALVNLGLTATAAEINTLDGITASTAELNILDGVTWTLTDYNTLTATAAELNVLDGITGIASEAEARAGTSNAVLMTPLRAENRISRFAAGGGTTTDLTASFENRLSVTFTATTKTMTATAMVGVNHQNATATDILGEFRLFDSVASSEIITITGGQTATGNFGYAVRFGLTMTSDSLVVGRSYTLRLYLRKGTAVGPTLPRDMRIEGVCL